MIVIRNSSSYSGSSLQAIEGNLSGVQVTPIDEYGFSIGSVVRKVTSPVRKIVSKTTKIHKKVFRIPFSVSKKFGSSGFRRFRKATKKVVDVQKKIGKAGLKVLKKTHPAYIVSKQIEKVTGLTIKQQLLIGAAVGTAGVLTGPSIASLATSGISKKMALSYMSAKLLGGGGVGDMEVDPAYLQQLQFEEAERLRLEQEAARKPAGVAKLLVPAAIGGAAILAATLA